MNNLTLALLLSGCVSGAIAEHKRRSPYRWAAFGLVAGPIAVAIVLWLRSYRTALPAPAPSLPPMRSIADEIQALQEMRERGLLDDAQFEQGKARVLAWPSQTPIAAERHAHPARGTEQHMP